MQLYSPVELSQLQPDFANLDDLNQTVQWFKNFLAKPHANLGRAGAVCPFAPRALKLNTVRVAAIRTEGMNQTQIEELVCRYRDQFLQLAPTSGEMAFYKAIMLVFPDVSAEQAPELIDEVQRKLKPYFVEQGLMIGEFHQHNDTPGLHNPDFRPLRSPVPMLAIRFMAESDLPFLERVTDEPQLRAQYLSAYLKQMEPIVKNPAKLTAARNALALAQAQMAQAQMAQAQTEAQTASSTPAQTTSAQVMPDYSPMPQVSKCPFARLMRFFKRVWGRCSFAWAS